MEGGECHECESPLFAPPKALLEQARRAVARVERAGLVTLYRYWPDRGTRGRLVDLSPTGMRFESVAKFEAEELVKVDGAGFRAVGAVAHRRSGFLANTAGLRFLTVSFETQRGGFVSTRA